MIRYYYYTFSVVLLFSSCATLFNQRETLVHVRTNEQSRLVVENDTTLLADKHILLVDRAKAPLMITAFTDSVSHTVVVESTLSPTYLLNLVYFAGFPGAVIDLWSPKRRTYPKRLYIDMHDDTYRIDRRAMKPLDVQYIKPNIVKLTPFKIAGWITPSAEISYERQLGKLFSVQAQAGYLLRNPLVWYADYVKPETRGFSLGLELRFYFRSPYPQGVYAGLDINYLTKEFNEEKTFYSGLYDEGVDTEHYTDTLKIARQTYTCNAKIGYQYVHKRFILDSFMGLGIKYRDVEYDKPIRENFRLHGPRHPNIPFSESRPGKYYVASFVMNIKLGYSF